MKEFPPDPLPQEDLDLEQTADGRPLLMQQIWPFLAAGPNPEYEAALWRDPALQEGFFTGTPSSRLGKENPRLRNTAQQLQKHLLRVKAEMEGFKARQLRLGFTGKELERSLEQVIREPRLLDTDN